MLASMFVGSVKALLVGASVFVPFERFAGSCPAQRTFRQGWATDVFTGLINGLLVYAALLTVLGGLDAGAAACAPQLRNWVETRPLWAQGLLAIALGDLGVYGIHRLEHTVPWLWRFHAVHHSAEEMDWLVAFRFHPVDLLLVRIASLGPLVALHVSPAAIGIFLAISGWQAWLVHANVRIPYGPLRWLLVSPEFHHWHHSADREAHDRNYASLVACWDVLFGTVHLPRGRQPLSYGIDEQVPAGWVNRFYHPFRRHAGAPAERTRSITESPQIAVQDLHCAIGAISAAEGLRVSGVASGRPATSAAPPDRRPGDGSQLPTTARTAC
jgi:sterol desaturase/sphingolipid hydroxylase (fatty acid hydroxylase superfamily)